MRAAAPATMGAENEVPDIHMYPGWKSRSGCSVMNSFTEPGMAPTRNRPGAPISGFEKPSGVEPQADHGATVSSAGVGVPLVSVAPTVITNGSLAGAYSTPVG